MIKKYVWCKETTWTKFRKRNLKRESEFLLIASQDNAMGTIYIKAKIDNTQKNNDSQLRGDKDNKINSIMVKYSILVQKNARRGTICRKRNPLEIVQEIDV